MTYSGASVVTPNDLSTRLTALEAAQKETAAHLAEIRVQQAGILRRIERLERLSYLNYRYSMRYCDNSQIEELHKLVEDLRVERTNTGASPKQDESNP